MKTSTLLLIAAAVAIYMVTRKKVTPYDQGDTGTV